MERITWVRRWGHMAGDRSQALGFLLLGILTFLPGTNQKCLRPFGARFSKSYGDSIIKFTIMMNFRCDLVGDSREVRFICNHFMKQNWEIWNFYHTKHLIF